MLQEAYNTGLFSHPWSLVVPGAAIAVTVLAFNALEMACRPPFTAPVERAVVYAEAHRVDEG